MDWINLEFIESVAIETPKNYAACEDLANICNQLLERTEKLESFTVHPNLPLVYLPVFAFETKLTDIRRLAEPI